ncbi:MAG: HAD family phosphatase [Clostridiaceae bacterium]|jgi:Cof subfamily protein (haloacid dehalogenase superfamily)|nr:HAD family phosphatase [Clostridiaceae bacterium]
MQYKLLSVDIDGTLINNKKEVTPKTKERIHKAIEKGVVFTISSGRPVQGVQLITDQLELDVPVITYNGAMVITGESRNIIYSCNMKKEDALQIESLGKQRDTLIAIWSDNKLYVNHMNELAIKYSTISGTEPVLYTEIEQLIEKGINKILWYDDVERIEEYERELKTILSPTVNFHTSQPFFLEFVDINASKAIALEKLGSHYGICKEEMIAIGDGYNDLSMIEYAGLGVAMENAPQEIKQAADFVTLSNEDDGVAYVIDKFILNE